MPWMNDFTSSDEKSNMQIVWPNEAKCCATIVVDYSVPSLSGEITDSSIDEALSYFGSAVEGVWLLELLKEMNIKATFVLIPIMIQRFPHIIQQILDDGHEIAIGGENKKDISSLSYDEEEKSILFAKNTIQDIAGIELKGWFSLPRTGDKHPGGFLSRNSLNLLNKHGFEYFGNGMADDVPYYTSMDVEGSSTMLTLPYYYHYDTQFFILFPGIGHGTGIMNYKKIENNWNEELLGALRFNRQFTMFLQPCLAYWSGTYSVLEKLFDRISTDKNIWQTTSLECATYWKNTYKIPKFNLINKPEYGF